MLELQRYGIGAFLMAVLLVTAGCLGGPAADSQYAQADSDEQTTETSTPTAASEQATTESSTSNNSTATSTDSDGDGLNGSREAEVGTDPEVVDTDGDSVSDFIEVREGCDPLDPGSTPSEYVSTTTATPGTPASDGDDKDETGESTPVATTSTATETPEATTTAAATTTQTSTTTVTSTATVTPTATSTPTTEAPTATPTATPKTTTDTPSTATQTPTSTPRTTTSTSGSPSPQTEWTVEIVRVIDGDTMEVRMPDGSTETIRLLGVDTPEVNGQNEPSEFEGIPDNENGEEYLAEWGERASTYATTRLDGETVTIRTDEAADRRGSYGRLLVYLTDDGANFNLDLIEEGYARMYDSSFSMRSTFADAEQTAQENDVGLWGYETPTVTTTTTPTQTTTATPVPDGGTDAPAIEIVRIDAEAEYVTIQNTGDQSVDLGGIVIDYDDGQDRTLPSYVLEAGETIRIGTGEQTSVEMAISTEYEGHVLLNSEPDTVTLYTQDGATIDQEEDDLSD